MKLIKADAKQRFRITDAPPGLVCAYVEDAAGFHLLRVKVEAPAPEASAKARITKRPGRHAVASTGRPITTEQVKALLAESFP